MTPRFLPPLCAGFVTAVLLSAGTVRAQIPCLSGFVRDQAGSPIQDVDLDFIDPVTGVKLITPGDNTDVTGFYNVCVLPGEYDVTFAPPPGSHFMGRIFKRIMLTAGMELNVVLETGVVVSGIVRDTAGRPVADVDPDADRLPGGRMFTPDDNSDLTGRYWLVLAPALYRLRFDPLPGSRLRGLQLDSVSVTRDTTIDITLLEGVLLSGRVSDEQDLPAPGIDVELRDPLTGAKIRVSNNTTDSLGRYQVAVPTGAFDLRFVPPRGSHFMGVLYDSVVITGDQVFDQRLSRGLLVTAFVHDTSGRGIPDADFDFTQESTGLKLFTPGDNSDTAGFAVVAVPSGLYTVQIDPPVGSLFDLVEQPGVNIQRDTTLDFEMLEAPRVSVTGRVTDGAGSGVAGVHIGLVHTATGQSVPMTNNFTDGQGDYLVMVPVGRFDVLVAPPAGSRWVARRVSPVDVNVDTSWSPFTLDSGYLIVVTVLDASGAPAEGADIDLFSETAGATLYTPSDNVNAAGAAQVAVPADRYTLVVDPPAGSNLLGSTLTGLVISSDTSLAFVLPSSGGTLPEDPFVLLQNFPNPFNGSTRIPFTILEESEVSIMIVNVLGQEIARLASGVYPVGVYSADWDGNSASGRRAPSGLYFYRIVGRETAQTRRLVLLR